MIQLNPDNMIRVELTPKEQKTLLKHCQSIENDIFDRIQNAQNGVLHLLVEDCNYLRDCILNESNRAKKPRIKEILGTIFNKLSPESSASSFAEEISGQEFDSIDALNEHLQGVMTDRNNTPDPEMGNLSPDQVSRLLYFSWDDTNFPLKFNKQLNYSDIKDSVFFTNTTIFLKTLIEMEKQPTATAKGNLNRKIVNILFDKLILDEDYKRFTREYNKVINEDDVFPLHIVRIVCEAAGLVHKRKNKFLVLKKYHNLLSEEKAGELYQLLFNSYFTKFNIGYSDRLFELDCIQQTIAYSILRLGEIADKYITTEALVEEILLPAVRREIREEIADRVRMEWVLYSRIIRPLEGFGLLECIYRKKRWQSEVKKVRKTGLFDKFVGREW